MYGGFQRKHSSIGFYVKGSVRIIKPIFDYYKGFQIKRINKGRVARAVVLRQTYNFTKKDNLAGNFRLNSSILIKKKSTLSSKYLMGPSVTVFRNKRVLSLFKGAI